MHNIKMPQMTTEGLVEHFYIIYSNMIQFYLPKHMLHLFLSKKTLSQNAASIFYFQLSNIEAHD